jgi:uncharacterized protein YdcH (DUF465 family)
MAITLITEAIAGVAAFFTYLKKRDEALVTKLSSQIEAGFKHVDLKFEVVDARFNSMDSRFNRIETEIKELRAELKTDISRVENNLEAVRNISIQHLRDHAN